ncbi:MAG: DUF721 domain-containing protein [Gemmobacter sp.]
MTRKSAPAPSPTRRKRGFEAASGLVQGSIRAAGEARGFAVTRLLTHWAEIVGDDMAAVTRPLKVGYAREGFGATLTVLAQGAMAPVIEMQKARIRDRVNACYGYNAISRVVLTQTGPTGFAEGQAPFGAAPKAEKPPDPRVEAQAQEVGQGVADDGLRSALELLARNVLSRART